MNRFRIVIPVCVAIAGLSAAVVARQTQPQLAEPTQAKPNFGSVVAKPEGAILKVPAGFTVDLYVDNLAGARNMIWAPNGDLFVAQT